MKSRSRLLTATTFAAAALFATALLTCSDDDNDENTGSACEKADTCYPGVKTPLSGGAAVCLDRITGGYCTHPCTTDAECCAVEGECKTGLGQVCSPFESTSAKYCFLRCDDAQVTAPGDSADTFCAKNAGAAFKCRSSGGGNENRKICTP